MSISKKLIVHVWPIFGLLKKDIQSVKLLFRFLFGSEKGDIEESRDAKVDDLIGSLNVLFVVLSVLFVQKNKYPRIFPKYN
jgi:hypothetical protein